MRQVKTFLYWLLHLRFTNRGIKKFNTRQINIAEQASRNYTEGEVETQRNLMLEQYVMKSHERGIFDPDLYDELENTPRP